MAEQKNKQSKKFLIAASGTGGHLLPALYIAKEIQKQQPDAEILFCGAGRPLEQKIINEKGGYPLSIIEIVGLSRRGLRGLLEFLVKIPKAILQTREIFKTFQPDYVIGVGGYISVLPVVFARLYGKKSLIHEAEHSPGLANKLLSYFAHQATTAFPDVAFPNKKLKQIHTGQPLNPDLYNISEPEGDRNLLILGGSQGAEALDKMLPEVLAASDHKFNIIHQCRQDNVESLQSRYQSLGLNAEVQSFIDDMPAAYAKSDFIISRAGLNSVKELEIVRRPSLIIPLPKAPEQKQNAEHLAEQGIAILVEESKNFKEDLTLALSDLTKLKILKENHLSRNSAQQIADLLLD